MEIALSHSKHSQEPQPGSQGVSAVGSISPGRAQTTSPAEKTVTVAAAKQGKAIM